MARVMARQQLLRGYGASVFLLSLAASVMFLILSPSIHTHRAKRHTAEQLRIYPGTRRSLGAELQLTPASATAVADAYPRSGGPDIIRHSVKRLHQAAQETLSGNTSVPEIFMPVNQPLDTLQGTNATQIFISATPEGSAGSVDSVPIIQPPARRDAVQSHQAVTTTTVEGEVAPLYSSITSLPQLPRDPPNPGETEVNTGKTQKSVYHIFHNVRVQYVGPNEMGLMTFHPANQPLHQERVQKHKFHSEGSTQLSVAMHYKLVEPNETAHVWCKNNWVKKPAILFHAPFANNIFHMFTDGILGVFQTLRNANKLPQHIVRLISGGQAAQQGGEEKECTINGSSQEVALISMSSNVFQQPWSFMLDHISTDQSTLVEMNGICFETLIVGTHLATDFYCREKGKAFLDERIFALRDFQRFAFMSALTRKLERLYSPAIKTEVMHSQCQSLNNLQISGASLAPSLTWASGNSLPRVTLANRALPASRALMNEAQIMAYITARWEVDTVSTTFEGALYDSMDLMRHTDVFLGMHGAGWTNALFLSEGAVAVQLLPYGWEIKDGPDKGWNLREDLYKDMVVGRNASYFSWMNGDPADAFLRRLDFEKEREPAKYVVHPDGSLTNDLPKDQMPKEWWIYQHTIAKLSAFIPTLELAFSAANIPEKDSWIETSASTLTLLEAETEHLRHEYVLGLQQQLPAAVQHTDIKVAQKDQEQPVPSTEPANTELAALMLVLPSELKGADEVVSIGQGEREVVHVLNEPQEDDKDDITDQDDADDGKIPKEVSLKLQNQISRGWTGEVL